MILVGVVFGLVVSTQSSGSLLEGLSSLEVESFNAPAWSSLGGLFCTSSLTGSLPLHPHVERC